MTATAHPVTVPPARTHQQRINALKLANEIRSGGARIKDDIRDGRTPAADVLAELPEHAGAIRVLDLLLAMPKIGRVKATAVLRSAGISPIKRLDGLTPRQRTALIALATAQQHRSERPGR